MSVDFKLKWWGYLHTSGSIQVKRFFDKRDLADARESDFVKLVVEPFDASDRTDAVRIVRDHLFPRPHDETPEQKIERIKIERRDKARLSRKTKRRITGL